MIRKKKNILPIFVLSMLTISALCVFMPNVRAVIFQDGFEGVLLEENYTSVWFTTDKITDVVGNAFINNNDPYAGDTALELTFQAGQGDPSIYMNYSYSSLQVLTEWNMWIASSDGSALNGYVGLYDSTEDFVNLMYYVIAIDWNTGDGEVQYVDHTGTGIKIADIPTDTDYHLLKIKMLSNEEVEYTWDSTTVQGTPRTIYANPRIDGCSLQPAHVAQTDGEGAFYDSHSIKVLDSYEEESGSCGSTAGLSPIGSFDGMLFRAISDQWVECSYDVTTSATFRMLDLSIGATMYDGDNTPSNYFAYLNGISLGSPDCFYPYGDTYVARWVFDTPITLTDVKPQMEFWHIVPLTSYTSNVHDRCYDILHGWYDCNFRTVTTSIYWQMGVSTSDLDDDGDVKMFTTNHASSDGQASGSVQYYDISYMLYYDELITPSPPIILDDTLTIANERGTDQTYSIPYFYTYDSSILVYTLSTPEVNTYIKIYHNGVEYGENQSFPILLMRANGIEGFTPFDVGFYNASLYRGGVRIVNESFYVKENPKKDTVVWSIPVVSTALQLYEVHYRYYNLNGKQGAIGMFSSTDDIIANPQNAVSFRLLEPNTTSSFDFTNKLKGTHYWSLFVNTTGGYFSPIGSIHEHIIFNPIYSEDSVNVEFSSLPYIANPTDQKLQYISGTHRWPGAEIWVKVNGYQVEDVSNDQFFSFSYLPVSDGYKNVTLEIYLNDSWIVLDYDDFVMTLGDGIIPPEGSNLRSLIQQALPDPTVRGIVGMSIAIVITFLPFIFAMKMKTRNVTINIPPILYTITFIIGVVIVGLLGFVGWEIMFFLCFIVIAVLVALWFQGKSSTSEA